MPIYICLCAIGVVFAGFILWLISLISVTWAVVQTSIFITGIHFSLIMSFIDTDKHEKFDQICEIPIFILVVANLPVIFVQLIVFYVINGYIDQHIQNRVNLKYP